MYKIVIYKERAAILLLTVYHYNFYIQRSFNKSREFKKKN